MREANKENLYLIEFSDSMQQIITNACASTNPGEALQQLVGCLNGKAILQCEAIEYSRSTGEPIRYGWKPFERWDGRLWINSLGNSPSLDKSDPLYKPLLKFLPEGKTTIVEVGNKNFVVRHVPSKWETDGTTPAYIEFTKSR